MTRLTPGRRCGVVSAADMLLHAYSVDSPLSDDPWNRLGRWLAEHVSPRQIKDSVELRLIIGAPTISTCYINAHTFPSHTPAIPGFRASSSSSCCRRVLLGAVTPELFGPACATVTRRLRIRGENITC
jgi:hypothetical protein